MSSSLVARFALVFFMALPIGLSAQLVHLSFTAPEQWTTLKLRGDADHINAPWDTGGMAPANGPLQLDIYYEQDLFDDGVLSPGEMDPANNRWRVQFNGYNTPEPFDFMAPLTEISVGEGYIIFAMTDVANSMDFELWLEFTQPFDPNDVGLPNLPLPPVGDLGTRFQLTGNSYYGLEGLGEAYLSAGFDRVDARYVDGLTPVPEPAAYGWVAATVAAGLIVRRVRRTKARRAAGTA